jgi:hypothetical protein
VLLSKTKQFVASTALLMISSAAKSADTGVAAGGKSQRGINHLELSETPGRQLAVCSNGLDKFFDSNIARNNLTVILEPLSTASMELIFTVSDILAEKEDHILFLVYSTNLSPSPMILTPNSIKKLEIDMTYNEIAAMYNVPKQNMLAQSDTRIGLANPSPSSKVNFKVNLDTNKILNLIRNGQSTIYVQAALLSTADFNAGKFDNMILSEADTITFVDQVTACSGNNIKILEKDDIITISDGNDVLGLTISPSGETKFFITNDIGKILSFVGINKNSILSFFGVPKWVYE